MAGVEIKLGRWMGAVPIEQGSEKGKRGERGLYRRREAHQKHEIKKDGGEMPDRGKLWWHEFSRRIDHHQRLCGWRCSSCRRLVVNTC